MNETPPVHVLTVESFEKIKSMLNPGGMVMMNFYGYITGEKGRASRSIYKTFEEAGFHVDLLATPGEEAYRNLIFLASEEQKDFSNIHYGEPYRDTVKNLTEHFIPKDEIQFDDALVLRDNQPILEKIYLPAALDWRRSSIQANLIPMVQRGMQGVK